MLYSPPKISPYKFELFLRVLVTIILFGLIAGCSPNISLLGGGKRELQESRLTGKGANKVLLIPITGFISISPKRGLLSQSPSLVQEVSSRLNKAAKDKSIAAVVLLINCPGGTVTDTDILHNEIMRFKTKTNKKVVAHILDVGASGGYYVSLAADHVSAQPTALVGSVGAIFITPKIVGLMDKVGVEVGVAKTGNLKDMGSPFKTPTDEEKKHLNDLVNKLCQRFYDLTSIRPVARQNIDIIAQAAVYAAKDALDLGLIDSLGYIHEAVEKAAKLAGIEPDPVVVAFRRSKVSGDTLYNLAHSEWTDEMPKIFDLGAVTSALSLPAGVYYLWPQAIEN